MVYKVFGKVGEECFDKFLDELEEDTKYLEESLYYTRKRCGGFYELHIR